MILVCTASIASYHNMYSVYMYIFQHCTQNIEKYTILIPFILDPCAPGGLYLGTKPVHILKHLYTLKAVVISRYPYLLKDATLS